MLLSQNQNQSAPGLRGARLNNLVVRNSFKNSHMSVGRSLLALDIVRRIKSAASLVILEFMTCTLGTPACKCFSSSSSGFVPVNGALTLSSSKTTQPKLYTSDRASNRLPRICSGDM